MKLSKSFIIILIIIFLAFFTWTFLYFADNSKNLIIKFVANLKIFTPINNIICELKGEKYQKNYCGKNFFMLKRFEKYQKVYCNSWSCSPQLNYNDTEVFGELTY